MYRRWGGFARSLSLMRGAPCYPGLMLFFCYPRAVVSGKQAEDGAWQKERQKIHDSVFDDLKKAVLK